MKISAKIKYGVASLIKMVSYYDLKTYVNLSKLSKNLDISKIYLEQIFFLLKKDGIVISLKGSGGGYILSKSPDLITLYDILASLEYSIFSEHESSYDMKDKGIERVIKDVFINASSLFRDYSKGITLKELYDKSLIDDDDNIMYYL